MTTLADVKCTLIDALNECTDGALVDEYLDPNTNRTVISIDGVFDLHGLSEYVALRLGVPLAQGEYR